MKKHFSIVMALLLLVSNSGLAINVHYCEGKIAAISSAFSKEEVCVKPVAAEKACCAKPDPTHKKCCSDKEVNLKSKIEKIVLKTISFDFDAVPVYYSWRPVIFSKIPVMATGQNFAYYCDANAPPLYSLYCRFTLFG